MIPNIELDVESFETILNKAKQKIQVIFPEWTNYNQHDSGIMLLELFAWMKEMQNYHLDQIGPEHLHTYLKILGVTPIKKKCAFALVHCFHVKSEIVIKKGHQFFAGHIPFETMEEILLYSGELLTITVRDPNGMILGENHINNKFNLNIFAFGEEPWIQSDFILRFSRGFQRGKQYQIYFDLKSDYQVVRNPIVKESFEPLVKIKIEYRSGSTWKLCKIIQDETYGLLTKGIIRIKIPEETGEPLILDSDCELKISLADGEYDVPPIINHIYLNPILTAQCETVIKNQNTIGIGNGFPNQWFLVGFSDIWAETIEILVEHVDRRGYFDRWERVENFDESSPEDLHYVVDETENKIIFGNGYRGMPPEGEIRITEGKRSFGVIGNVKKGSIHNVDADLFQVTNPDHAWGGTNAESLEECFFRFQYEIKNSSYAVTNYDFEELVKKTPGLMIQHVKATVELRTENSIHIVVHPFSLKQHKTLSQSYLKNIMNYIEPRCLIGTNVHILSPEYIHITLFMELEVYSHFRNPKQEIDGQLKQYFSEIQKMIGKQVSYGEIYGVLESIACINRVVALAIDATGQGVERNMNGDVILPENGMACLEHIQYSILFTE